MKDNLPRFTLRIPQNLLEKLAVIAEYEGRTKNKEIKHLVKQCVDEFEKVHGPICVNKGEPGQ